MRYCLLFFLTVTLTYHPAIAQKARTLRIKAGEDVAQAYSPDGFYRFPQFGPASLFFKDGGRNSGKQFNYNILSGTLQFIGPKGDTLDLSGQENIDSVVFTGTTFLYNDGFMEVVARLDSMALLKKNYYQNTNRKYRCIWHVQLNSINCKYEKLFKRHVCL